jgi:hypothetical protein
MYEPSRGGVRCGRCVTTRLRSLLLAKGHNQPKEKMSIEIECCPRNTPIAPGSGSAGAMAWEALTTIAVPARQWSQHVYQRPLSSSQTAPE